jgi:signal transduction histidine kinase
MDEKSLSQIRHDVRTPLNAVLGLAELLTTIPEGSPLPAEQQRRMYDLLKSSAGDLHKRIEKLFDMLDKESA